MNALSTWTDVATPALLMTIVVSMSAVGIWRLCRIFKLTGGGPVDNTGFFEQMRLEQEGQRALLAEQHRRIEEMRTASDHACEQMAALEAQRAAYEHEMMVAQAGGFLQPSSQTGHGMRGEYQPPGRMNLPSQYKTAFSSRELFAWQDDMRTHDTGLQQVLNAILAGCRRLAAAPAMQHHNLQYTINFGHPTSAAQQRYSVRLREPADIAGVYDLLQVLDPETLQYAWHFGDYQVAIEEQMIPMEVRPGRDLTAPDPDLTIPEPLPVPNVREQRSIQLD